MRPEAFNCRRNNSFPTSIPCALSATPPTPFNSAPSKSNCPAILALCRSTVPFALICPKKAFWPMLTPKAWNALPPAEVNSAPAQSSAPPIRAPLISTNPVAFTPLSNRSPDTTTVFASIASPVATRSSASSKSRWPPTFDPAILIGPLATTLRKKRFPRRCIPCAKRLGMRDPFKVNSFRRVSFSCGSSAKLQRTSIVPPRAFANDNERVSEIHAPKRATPKSCVPHAGVAPVISSRNNPARTVFSRVATSGRTPDSTHPSPTRTARTNSTSASVGLASPVSARNSSTVRNPIITPETCRMMG